MMPQMPVAHGGIGFGQTFATSTYGTTVTAHASSVNTQGTPVELIASTAYDAHWIEVMALAVNTNVSYAINILIGAATEDILIPRLAYRARTVDGGRWLFPIFIPKGSRIAASIQSTSTTGPPASLIGVNLFNAGIGAGGLATKVVQYGTLTSSLGVNIDPGAVAHTDANAEITSSTTFDHNWLVLTVANTDGAFATTPKWLIDVLIGEVTESVLVSDLPIGGSGTLDYPRPDCVFHLPVFVPKGSRLSVRARCSSTTDGDRDLYVTLHGC